MDYVLHELTSPGVLLGAANIAQSAVYQGRVKKREREMHREEINLMRQHQRDEMNYVKKTYIMSSIHDMERHFQQLNSDLLDGSKEFEKDMVDQRNLWSQTIILAATIMILATISVLVQGILPNKSSEHPPNDDIVANRLYFAYSVSNAGSMAFLFVTIVIYVEVVGRISKFSIERASQHAKNLKSAMFETQSLLDRLMPVPNSNISRRQEMMDHFANTAASPSSSRNYSYQSQYPIDTLPTDQVDVEGGSVGSDEDLTARLERERLDRVLSTDATEDSFYKYEDAEEGTDSYASHQYSLKNTGHDKLKGDEEDDDNEVKEDDEDDEDKSYVFTPRGVAPSSEFTTSSSAAALLRPKSVVRPPIAPVASARSVTPLTAASRPRTFTTPQAYPANRFSYGTYDDNAVSENDGETASLLPPLNLAGMRQTSTSSRITASSTQSRVPFSTVGTHSLTKPVPNDRPHSPGTPDRPDLDTPISKHQTSGIKKYDEKDIRSAGMTRLSSTILYREKDAHGNLIRRPPTRKAVALMEEKQTDHMFRNHERDILDVYLYKRDRITLDMMKSYSLPNSFNKYWTANCEHLDQWGIKLFYIGTTLM